MNKCKLLADNILEILEKGIRLSDEVIQYIDSTFSNPSIEELEEILQDDSNCETDSLIELLFFPDARVQYQLEDFLESQPYEEADEKKVSDLLCRPPLGVTFHFPENRGSFSLEIPQSVARQFLKRLNISKQMDRNLLSTIKANTAAKDKIRFAVRLRNSRFAPTDNALWFLSAFFERWDFEDKDVFKCFDFVLLFLEELQEDEDIFEALMKKKRFYLKHLKRAEKFEEQLQKTNIETLILQGKNPALMNKNEARENMAIIDKISYAVFEKTEYFDAAPGDNESLEFRSPRDFKNIIKTLSSI